MRSNFSCNLSPIADFFFKAYISTKISGMPSESQTVSHPDQVQHIAGPDLGPKCLQRLLADDTSKQRVDRIIGKVNYCWQF